MVSEGNAAAPALKPAAGAAGDLYFAYGSNLSTRRLQERVASAQPLGAARLRNYAFHLDKPGRDGSAKANIRPDAGAEVWGVVFRLAPEAWTELDRYEGGYQRVSVRLEWASAPETPGPTAETYLSALETQDRVATERYRAWMTEGAREHALPPAWCAMLAALPVRPDPPGSG
ncbi:MAG: gamma-glutamylcyclotransferase family protein [Myxococcota bacterium]